MTKFIDIKGKVFLYSNRITFSYNQWCHQLHIGSTQYKQLPLKKKGRRRKGKRWKRGEEEKRMERVCSEGKGKGRMRCGRKDEEEGEGEGKEEEKEKHKMEKAIHERHRPLQKYSLARS